MHHDQSDPMTQSFSILGRIGGDATKAASAMTARRPPLSVSSVGSEAMQRSSMWGQEALGIVSFQYPRSDRRRCNLHGAKLKVGDAKLSVSSVGSEAMQLECSQVDYFASLVFQYPRSDRRRCN